MKSETQIDATDLGLLVALEPCHVFFVIPPRLLLQLTGGKVLLVCALKTHLLAHTVTRAMPKLLPAGNRKRKKCVGIEFFENSWVLEQRRWGTRERCRSRVRVSGQILTKKGEHQNSLLVQNPGL